MRSTTDASCQRHLHENFRKSVLPLTACIRKVVPSQDSGNIALTSIAAQSFLPYDNRDPVCAVGFDLWP